jgi:sulfhydrogenase subunit alpha
MTTYSIHLEIEPLTRVEGHGSIVLNANNGKIDEVLWKISEAPRFFESFMRGRPWHEMAHITSRICGICSIGHTLASLKATEAAMGFEISEQTQILRRLAIHAENMQSHVLHVGYLVAPDLFNVGNVLSLIGTHRNTFLKVVKLHRTANEFSDLLCGRTTHPINMIPGGFSWIPSAKQLNQMRSKLVDVVDTANDIAEIVRSNARRLPSFSRETEYIALTSDDEYALYDGMIGSTDTGRHPVEDYLKITNEFIVPQSTAKYCKHARDSYMVGALARFNLNSKHLSPLATHWAGRFHLVPGNTNPFMNSIVQLVEVIHSLEDSITLIEKLLTDGLDRLERPKLRPKAGRGVGAVDVPRGTLFHDYTYDEKGICTKVNCIIPTNQNHNNIQKDMEAFAPTLLGRSEREIEVNLEMLVRAYDPCISCSTHFLKVKFVR